MLKSKGNKFFFALLPICRSVEVIDTDGVCMGPALPHALFGAGGAGIV